MINLTKRTTRMDAVLSLEPEAKCYTDGINAELQWPEGYTDTIPTEEEIDTEVTRLEAEWTATQYARKREAEYPSIADLVVALYDTDDKSAIETKRAAVKLKYPKP